MIIITSRQLHGPKPVRVDEKDLKSLEDCDCPWFLFWFMTFFGNEDKGFNVRSSAAEWFLNYGKSSTECCLAKVDVL